MSGKKKERKTESAAVTENPKRGVLPIEDRPVDLAEWANGNAGNEMALMGGFVHDEKFSGRMRDTAANYRKRFEEYRNRPA